MRHTSSTWRRSRCSVDELPRDDAELLLAGEDLLAQRGGDRYFTDGELAVGTLTPKGSPRRQSVEVLPSPTPVVIKNHLWSWLRPMLDAGGAASGAAERN